MAKVLTTEHVAANDLYENRAKKPKITPQQLQKMRERDNEIVRGIFSNNEQSGAPLAFSFLKYAGDPIVKYEFEHGKVYSIPRMVATHIVNGCYTPDHVNRQDDRGKVIAVVGRKNFRFSFQPLDFMDAEAIRELTPSNIEEVNFV